MNTVHKFITNFHIVNLFAEYSLGLKLILFSSTKARALDNMVTGCESMFNFSDSSSKFSAVTFEAISSGFLSFRYFTMSPGLLVEINSRSSKFISTLLYPALKWYSPKPIRMHIKNAIYLCLNECVCYVCMYHVFIVTCTCQSSLNFIRIIGLQLV